MPLESVNQSGSVLSQGARLARRKPADPARYRRGPNNLIVSKYFDAPMWDPLNPGVIIPPLVEAHSLDDIRPSRRAVAVEQGKYYAGLENNLYFPEFNLYVINTDNFTFYVIAEAVDREDIVEGASLFTFDAHLDVVSPPEFAPIQKLKGQGLKQFSVYVMIMNPLQQLQSAQALGFVRSGGIHLFSPISPFFGEREVALMGALSRKRLGKNYVFPNFPRELFRRLPRNKIIAHVDIDYHANEGEKDIQFLAESYYGGSPSVQSAVLEKFPGVLLAEPPRVDPEQLEEFSGWVKENGFFKRAGVRIICVSPNCVHPQDMIWLTKRHVELVMEES